MASTNKTPQLGLNQWAAGDEVLRADFNADNAKIEAAVAGMQNLGTCVTGNYVGDGVATRHIELGFRPRFLILFGNYINDPARAFIFQDVCYYYYCSSASKESGSIPLTDTGFTLSHHYYFNGVNQTTHYVAFR